MSDLDLKRRLLMESIAEMYYISGMSQDEIAHKISMSRSNVSKLLKACISEKIINFNINYVRSSLEALEKALQDKFKLKKAIVVPSDSHLEACKQAVGQYAAEYLESIIQNNMLIGISWGTTLYYVVNQLRLKDVIHADVIQMIGGMSSKSVDTDGQELARKMAQTLNGRADIMQVPMLVKSRLLKSLILEEPSIVEHFKMFEKIDIAVVGLGSNKPDLSAVYKSGNITKEEAEDIVKMGAIGDLCGRHIDINGKPCLTSISERVIGIELAQLKRINTVVGVAAGIEKAEATLGSLRGSFVNVLVIDENLANYILNAK